MNAQRTPQVVVASVMRPAGDTGVQTHIRTVEEYVGNAELVVASPFSERSLLLAPTFGMRRLLSPVSGTADVWWYRTWHGRFLDRPLRHAVERGTRSTVIYAQCPVSAAAALRVRTVQPVVMAVHFNLSQADEWATKGRIPAGGRLFKAIRAFEASVLPKLDGLVHVSQFTRSELEARVPEVRGVPSIIIPNAVPGPDGPAHHAAEGDLVSVGSLEPRKNQAYLLDVLAATTRRGQSLRLTLVGDGPERSRLVAKTRELGLEDRVTFLGHRSDVREIVRRHRLFVHAAQVESFGIAVVEAMAVGVPVVAPRVGGIPEIVRNDIDGLFWPLDDPEAAAEILTSLISDPARRDRLAAGARARAADFAPDVHIPRLLEFLTARPPVHPHVHG